MNKLKVAIGIGTVCALVAGYLVYRHVKAKKELNQEQEPENNIQEPEKTPEEFRAEPFIPSGYKESNVMEYARKIQELRYSAPRPEYEDYKRYEDLNGPYVIRPDEFGSEDGYSGCYLTLYSDGALVDNLDGKPVNLEETIGRDNLSHIGEYELNELYIRDDRFHCDYNITAIDQTYEEFLEGLPKEVLEDDV